MHAAEVLQERRQFLELVSFPSVDEKRGACEAAFAGSVEFGKDRDELDGEIVDAVEAHILERMQDGAFSGAGEAGEDDELARFGMVGRRVGVSLVLSGSATRAQFFTRR
jgi:hypothetical protein